MYVTGDATDPPRDQPGIIVHVCNDQGGWGRGFVVALSQRWPEPERCYRAWARGQVEEPPFGLGQVLFVRVDGDLWVANLVGQHGYGWQSGKPPVRYEALRQGLKTVAEEAKAAGTTVHMPRIGCGLAGGKWEDVRQIIEEELVARDVPVVVYDLPAASV